MGIFITQPYSELLIGQLVFIRHMRLKKSYFELKMCHVRFQTLEILEMENIAIQRGT